MSKESFSGRIPLHAARDWTSFVVYNCLGQEAVHAAVEEVHDSASEVKARDFAFAVTARGSSAAKVLGRAVETARG